MLTLASSCGPKEVDIAVNVVSTVCDPDLDPFAGVTAIEVRISGPGIDTPLLTRVLRSEGRVQIPQIPAGPKRVIEVRGLAESSSARPLSVGRSVPTDIPDVLTDSNRRLDINIFMRRIDTFTPPSSAAAPRDCSTMRALRAAHTATLLKDGRVYIAGGFRLDGPNRVALVDTEFFDPNKGSFEQGPTLALNGGTPLPRAFHTATLLRNGQVMLYGGERYNMNSSTPQTLASVLIFDVDQGAYGAVASRVSPQNVARTRHLAIAETSGKVLIIGGQKGSTLVPVPEVEWFDPTTNQVYVATAETFARSEAAAAVVQDGKVVVVAGGLDANNALTDEVAFFKFDGSTVVRAGANQRLRHPRRGAAAVTLSDDKTVIVMGGYSDPAQVVPNPSSETIKTASNSVDEAPATIGERGEACAALLAQGSVLAVGGRKAGPMSDGSATLIRFDSKQGSVTSAAAAPIKVPRYLHTCTTLSDGSVLVTGGINDASGTPQVLRDAWIYTPIPGE